MKRQILKISIVIALALGLATSYAQATSQEDLVRACQSGNFEGVKKAIADGAQVNTLDVAGNAPLAYAFFWPDIVKYFTKSKLSLYAATINGV